MKAKTKTYVASLAMGIPALLGLILIVCISYISDMRKSEDLMESYAEGIANGISSFFTDAAAVASAASTLRSAQDLDWEVAGMDFTGFIRSDRFIHRISLVDTNGYVYDAYETGPDGNRWQGGRRTENNSDPYAKPVVVTEREYFRALVAENTDAEFSVMINEPFVPVGLTEKAFVTTVPIISNGQVAGAVSVAQTALELSRLYEDLAVGFLDRFGRGAHMYLVSYGEQLVSDLEYNDSYGAYMDELFGTTETVSVFVLGEDVVSVIDTVVRDEMRVISARIGGRSCLVVGRKIEDTPFAVCIVAPKIRMLYSSHLVIVIGIIFAALTVLAAGRWFVFFLPKVPADAFENGARNGKPPRRSGGGDENFRAPLLPLDEGK